MEYFFLILLLSTLSLVSSQSQYVLPDHYFINCGSTSDTYYTNQKFTGDDNHTTFSFSGGRKAVTNNQTSEIYRTARVFTKKSWYELEADGNNTFVMVNLHFSPIVYKGIELSTSKFNVSVFGYTLLSNFNVGNSTIIKDFIIPVGKKRKFRIEFTPLEESSPAFVNAIEAFTTPPELFRHGASIPRISPLGIDGDMDNISSSYSFNPIYRINVGGNIINVVSDTLRRNWTRDDKFIVNSESAETVNPFDGRLSYNKPFAATYDAPGDVYKTARRLKGNSTVNHVTWSFGVKKNTLFLVRAHFCDFISTGPRDFNEAFNFFVYGNYVVLINPGEKGQAVPFYYDYVVDSVEFGFVNVSIGAIYGISRPVLLNGLEIMEMLKNSSVGETRYDSSVGETSYDGKSSKKVYVVVGCVVGGLVIVLLIGFFIGFKYRKTKPVVGTKTESNAVPSQSIDIDFTLCSLSQIPNLNLSYRFEFDCISQATNNFDEKLVIGKGGFGKVYRGTFPDGKVVAVKRSEKGHSQGRPEFVQEITVLSKIRHQHLVSLVGYCDENSEMILVFEYMEKGTLQEHLYDMKNDDAKLSWNQRLEICISAARGLHYLHTGSDAGIIHRDVKSTNILLDEKYIAKVADFGISRLDNLEEGEMEVKGSFGYFDPEYISCMKLTQKSDVYSFGVVLLEVLCARKALDNALPSEEVNLADWAINQIKDGMQVEKIMDPYLVGKINPNSLRNYLETVKKCLKNTGDERPAMVDVLWDLKYALRLQEPVVDKEPHEDSTTNTLELPMSIFVRSPSKCEDDEYEVNDSAGSSYPSESQVLSQLKKIDEAR